MNLKNLLLVDSDDKQHYSIKQILNKIIEGNALEVLKKIPEKSVDLVFMDPPYFLQLPKKKLKRWNVKTDVEGVEDEWDKFSSFEEYDNFIKTILLELRRILKENGTIWTISTYHSIFRIGNIMQDLGYWILNNVLWLK